MNIEITDINNKVPEVGEFLTEISRYENATTGDFISRVNTTDLDRDGILKGTCLKPNFCKPSCNFRATQCRSIFYQL